MIEMHDGSFTSIEPFTDELLAKFRDAANEGIAKTLHVGSEFELVNIKNRRTVEDRLDEIESQLKELSPPASSIIRIPTEQEIHDLLEPRR